MTVADSTLPHCAKNSRSPSLVVEYERPPMYSFAAIGFLLELSSATVHASRTRKSVVSEARSGHHGRHFKCTRPPATRKLAAKSFNAHRDLGRGGADGLRNHSRALRRSSASRGDGITRKPASSSAARFSRGTAG